MTLKFGDVELFDYQEEDVLRAIEEGQKSIFLAYEMALGKTITAVAFALLAEVKTVLVVAPKNTFRSWASTVQKMSPETAVYRLETDAKNVANFAHLNNGEPGFYLIGWEMMRTGAVFDVTVDMIIGDEIHRIQNYGKSATSDVFRHINSEYKVALSGTPAHNRPERLFSPINWLWEQRYKTQYKHWYDKFWLTRRNGSVIDIIREKEPNMVINDLPFFIRRLKKDHRGDLPAVLPEITIDAPMTPQQTKVYEQFKEVALAWLDDHPVATSLPLTQEIRLRQVALGVPKVDKETDKVTFALNCKSTKIAMLIDLIEDMDEHETLFVLTHSAAFIPSVVHQLNKKGIPAVGFTGETTQKERDEIIETDFGTKYRVVVAGIAAVAEGLDGLQHKCHTGVWLSKHPNGMLNRQAGERLDRPGQKEPVQWYNMIAPGTKDEDTEERLEEQQGNLDQMLDNS